MFAKEGASVMLADIAAPALERAQAKVLQLVPDAQRVETKVCTRLLAPGIVADAEFPVLKKIRCAMSQKRAKCKP